MRPDYCPMVNEPCQSMCDTPCSVNRLARQRTWVGLTDDELSEIYNRTEWNTVNGWEYEQAIEAKLKEKNT